jgi:hypothetical protein
MSETTSAPAPDEPAVLPAETPADTPAEGAEPEPEAAPKREPWYEARMRHQAAKIDFAERERERVARELEVTRAALTRYEQQQRGQTPPQGQDNQPGGQQAQGYSQADVEARAAQLADERTTANDFNSRCNATFEAGKAAYPDFADKLGAFQNLGGLGQHIDFVKDVISLPNGPQVLYSLASDLDQAAYVLGLPPRAQAMALANLASNLASSAPVARSATVTAQAPVTAPSRAPPPTKPIAGKASQAPADIYDPRISMDAFIKARSKKA